MALLFLCSSQGGISSDHENFFQVSAFLPSPCQEIFVMGLLEKYHSKLNQPNKTNPFLNKNMSY